MDLRREDAQHRERFRHEKLEAIFLGTLGYACEKMYEGCRSRGEPGRSFGSFGLGVVQDTLDAFREALARRGIETETYDSVKYEYDLIAYPLQQLKAYFEEGTTCDIANERAAHIFAYFVEQRIEELKRIARELDKDYAN